MIAVLMSFYFKGRLQFLRSLAIAALLIHHVNAGVRRGRFSGDGLETSIMGLAVHTRFVIHTPESTRIFISIQLRS